MPTENYRNERGEAVFCWPNSSYVILSYANFKKPATWCVIYATSACQGLASKPSNCCWLVPGTTNPEHWDFWE